MVWSNARVNIIGAFSRNHDSATELSSRCENSQVFASAQSLADASDLIFLTVPDAVISSTAHTISWRSDQAVVHCSAATEVSVLEVARIQGAAIGGFHPLQLFGDPEISRNYLAGSSVAIEAENPLQIVLEELAKIAKLKPIRLKPGTRVAYHLAGNYAASGLLALLKEAQDLWIECGLEGKDALAALLPLSLGTLQSAGLMGLSKTLSGPVSRGDIEVLQRHLDLAAHRAAGDTLYRELLKRLVTLTVEPSRLTSQQIASLEATLSGKVQNVNN